VGVLVSGFVSDCVDVSRLHSMLHARVLLISAAAVDCCEVTRKEFRLAGPALALPGRSDSLSSARAADVRAHRACVGVLSRVPPFRPFGFHLRTL
jgi:hypothetical protein